MEITRQFEVSSSQASAREWVHSLWFRIVLITAFALGIVFRLSGLGNKMYSHDEAYASLRAAGYHKGDVLTGIRDGKDHPVEDVRKFLRPGADKNILDTLSITALSGPHQAPLFYLLAHSWMRLIGYTPAAMRGLAAIFGLLSIPAMYWFARELFQSPKTAMLSTALFSISPFHILFSQDARPYSLWTLATLLSSAALLRAVRKNSPAAWSIYSLTLILGMYSHQLFILPALAHGFYIAGTYLLHRQKGYSGFLSAGLLAFLAYIPWLYMVITYWDRALEGMNWVNLQLPWERYIQRWALIFSSPFLDFDFGFGNLVPYLLRAGVLVLIAFAFLFLVLHGSRQEKIFLLPMIMIPAGALILPDLILGGIRSIGGRYFVPVNIATILVVAYFLKNRLDQAHPKTNAGWRLLVGLLIAAGIASNVNSLQADIWWNKELGRVRPEFVQEIDRDRSLLIVSSGQNGSTLGDVLLLSLEIDSNVYFRLPEEVQDSPSLSSYGQIYWFPGSNQEVEKVGEKEQLLVKEVLDDTLWRIEGSK